MILTLQPRVQKMNELMNKTIEGLQMGVAARQIG
jgi:hypothetical protein